jgi:hypothetical protein
MPAMAQTFLDLPPQMGGQQFGPFYGTVQIGSDSAACQIVLNTMPGIAPIHAQLTDQGDGTYMIAPTQRGYGLFVAQGGGAQLKPCPGATVVNPGDSIIVGTPAGPRFNIRRVEGPAGSAGSNVPKGGGSGMGSKVMNELWRQQYARLMYRNPIFRQFQHMSFRYRSGALSNPRVLVGLITGSIAIVGAGIAGCAGIVAAAWSGLFGG